VPLRQDPDGLLHQEPDGQRTFQLRGFKGSSQRCWLMEFTIRAEPGWLALRGRLLELLGLAEQGGVGGPDGVALRGARREAG
jgi:hypothetical protein